MAMMMDFLAATHDAPQPRPAGHDPASSRRNRPPLPPAGWNSGPRPPATCSIR